jgi:hypothetical protein
MSLLTVIQRSCRLLSIPVPTEVVNSTDTQVQQLYEIANEEGNELAGSYNWQIMRKQHTFVTTATPAQTSAVPVDWDRFVANTFFNRSQQRTVIGPITPQQWQAIQAQPQLNRVFLAFIERDGQFLITPTPAAGETIAYEYVTKDWAYSDDVIPVPKADYTADTDTAYMDEKLIVLGVRWRFLKSKGLDYAEDFRTYMSERQQKQARDGGNGMITTTGDGQYLLSPNMPIGSFPGP